MQIGMTKKIQSMSNIVEYTRQLPFQPEQKMFKAKWRNQEYHSDNIVNIEEWLQDKIDNVDYYDRLDVVQDKAINSFFDGTNTSKD